MYTVYIKQLTTLKLMEFEETLKILKSPAHTATVRCNVNTFVGVIGEDGDKCIDVASPPQLSECGYQLLIVVCHSQDVT